MPFCTRPEPFWPWPHPLPQLGLSRCTFDTRLLDTSPDPATAAIPLPGSLRSAAAKRRGEYLAGRLCAAAAIGQLGQPAVWPGRAADGAPEWPAGLCGSISHSRGQALAVAGDSRHWKALGLDIEAVMAPERARRLAGEILHGAELQHFHQLEPQAAAEYLSLAFSAKESLFKALYPLVGRRFHFAAACLLDCADDGMRMELCQTLSAAWPEGSRIDGQFSVCADSVLTLIAISA